MPKKEILNNFVNYSIIFGIILPLLFLFTSLNPSQAQVSDSGDAIAVRIVPNPNNYSVYRWYDSQGFTGSPQALIVDGYEAVRDGRTVYVNAANVEGKAIHTNIYLISYNQDSSSKTVDILGQIVKNWKFNNNLQEKSNPGPACSISSLTCLSDSDCASDQVCATSTVAANSCQLKTVRNCLVDSDCPQNFFCDSVKAKIIRDIKRIGQTEEIKESLYQYKLTNGSFPKLSAGSYLANHSISVWPSWKDSFLSAVGMSASLIDPINRLGSCPSYDAKTCWNKDTQRFVYTPQANYLMLPTGSYGFVYKTDTNGSNYSLCAVMETRENTPELNFQFLPNNPTASNCVTATGIISGGSATNTPPRIVDLFLTGSADEEFNAFVNVSDDQGNPISWALNTNVGGSNWGSWSAAPILQSTSNINQKKIYAARAGAPGTYMIQLNLSDGQGTTGIYSTTTPITIINPKPLVEVDNGEYSLTATDPFSFSFYFSDNNLVSPVTVNTASVQKLSGPNNFNLLALTKTLTAAGVNRYQVTFQGVIPANNFSTDSTYTYRVTVTDKYGAASTKDFKITIKVDAPSLNFNCPANARLGDFYSCFLGYAEQAGHQLTYTSSNLPAGVTIKIASTTNQNQNNNINTTVSVKPNFLEKVISYFFPIETAQALTTQDSVFIAGTTTAPYSGNVVIKVANEYGASSTKSFLLNINNYCGDGVKQRPNGEAKGGAYNDGYEDCDGNDGVTQNVVGSSINLQYACGTLPGTKVPYPIFTNNYCIYKSPFAGGGYCGDGYCQVTIPTPSGDKPMENYTNCAQDCVCTPQCDNKCVGDPDGCGNTCTVDNTPTAICAKNETKACTTTYSQGLPTYCAGFPIQGTQTCNSTCTGWSACSAGAPSIVAASASACNATSPQLDGYACCELTYCVHDACGCCGRYSSQGSDWIDLKAQAIAGGYSVVKYTSPDGGVCTTPHNTQTAPQVCTCGTSGCLAPSCPANNPPAGTNDSCVMSRSNSNPANWWLLTNHTTVYYRCWQ